MTLLHSGTTGVLQSEGKSGTTRLGLIYRPDRAKYLLFVSPATKLCLLLTHRKGPTKR